MFRRLPTERVAEARGAGEAVFLGNHFYAEMVPQRAVEGPATDLFDAKPWTLATFQAVHRGLLEDVRPDIAGKFRVSTAATSRAVLAYANESIELARRTEHSAKRTEQIFIRAARFYAALVTAQLFERGNEYWARETVNELLRACGCHPGTAFDMDETQLGYQVLAVTLGDEPELLAKSLMLGFLAQRKRYQSAKRS